MTSSATTTSIPRTSSLLRELLETIETLKVDAYVALIAEAVHVRQPDDRGSDSRGSKRVVIAGTSCAGDADRHTLRAEAHLPARDRATIGQGCETWGL